MKPQLHCILKPGELVERTHISFCASDLLFIKLIKPGIGVIPNVVNVLLRKFIEQCKSYGITDHSHSDEFIRGLVNCTITLNLSGDSPVSPTAVRPIVLDGRGPADVDRNANVPVNGRPIEATRKILPRKKVVVGKRVKSQFDTGT